MNLYGHTIIYIHKNDCSYLNDVFNITSKNNNCRIILIGDEYNKKYSDKYNIEFYSIKDYTEEFNYTHISVNIYDYENDETTKVFDLYDRVRSYLEKKFLKEKNLIFRIFRIKMAKLILESF